MRKFDSLSEREILALAGGEIIKHGDGVAIGDQPVDEMGAEEPCPSGD